MTPAFDPWSLGVFTIVLVAVALLGFGGRLKKRSATTNLEEWGLGGRRYGAFVSWFLMGGDMFTAYTVIAVPGLVYATGAPGFFALAYTVMLYPIMFGIMPILRAVAAKSGAVTAADIVYDRIQSRPLEIAIALTGVAAVVPYIALQLAGIEAAAAGMGLNGRPVLIAATLALASYTYLSGLQASTRIAFVKDVMIYVVVAAAIALIPAKLGGYHAVFTATSLAMHSNLLLSPGQAMPFATLAFGSALAVFMYPHSQTGIFAARDSRTIRRNAVAMPAYSLLLGLIALMGYMAHAAHVTGGSSHIVPGLFRALFPPWFCGFAFAAIVVTAMVPASVMAIGAANLFTRNVWAHHPGKTLGAPNEATIAKRASVVITIGALAFVMLVRTNYVIDLQLLGGLWVLQTIPAVATALYAKRLHPVSLLSGWLAGIGSGTVIAAHDKLAMVHIVSLGDTHIGVYIGVLALLLNLAISLFVEITLRLFGRNGSKKIHIPEFIT